MDAEPWVSDESRMAVAARRAFARAVRQPVRVLAIALAAAGLYTASRALRPPSYEATLYLRLAETELSDPTIAPRPPAAVREYISNVALSRSRLEQIMRKYRISERYLARDPVAAVDDFREDVRIDVSRNYFIYDRRPDDPPRSALVTIALRGSDAAKTRDMLHEIGDVVLQEQLGQRSARLAQTREVLAAQLAQSRARVQQLQGAMRRLWEDLPSADAPGAVEIRARMAALQAEIQGAIDRSLALEKRVAAVSFSAAAEGQQLGLNFQLFDESLVASAPPLTPGQLARRAAVALAIALLLTVPVVGAFDDRIHAPGDLAARGLPVFGALPRFPGDEAGSYRARPRAGRV